jgi:hypothetical protein
VLLHVLLFNNGDDEVVLQLVQLLKKIEHVKQLLSQLMQLPFEIPSGGGH